jgi:putative tryptophan/tyrosine transport system substrate-binding protein
MLLAASSNSESQQLRSNVPRIGWLSPSSPSLEPTPSRLKSFHQGLAELGYVEGKNIAIEYRYAEGKLDRLPEFAAELVRLNVNIIVTTGNESMRAAKNATRTIPIVMGFASDPVGSGFVESLARPGGNITGLSTSLEGQIMGNRLEVLKEMVPSVSSVFALWHQASPGVSAARKEMEGAARVLGMKLELIEVRDTNDFDRVFSYIGKGQTKGVVLLSGAFMRNNLRKIVDLAVKNQLPAVYLDTLFVEAGGLMSYGAVRSDEFRRAASFVDKILKGIKPAELPVEQPTKFELAINLKTAKQIGVTIPPNVLARADRVIK